MKEISFNSIENVRLGHFEDKEGVTGCSVLICEKGATGGVDVRGGAPGTRETDLLKPENLIEKVHAVLLSGGSAYGLDAASGVMEYLEEKHIGFNVGVGVVPIVLGAVLFDLNIGSPKIRPDKNMGYKASVHSEKNLDLQGNIGAGMGATVGKLAGFDYAVKGGLGTYAIEIGDLKIGAVVAVNALGDIIDPENNNIIMGAYDKEKKQFIDLEKELIKSFKNKNDFTANTTIGVIVTNGKLSKANGKKVASMAQNAFAKVIRPAHTSLDGDTIFALSVGQVEVNIDLIGHMASKVMEKAILNGVKNANTIGNYIGFKDI